jgi:hypothetical protein
MSASTPVFDGPVFFQPAPLLIEVEPNHFIDLGAVIEIEQDPDEPERVLLTLPGTGYEPAAPLLVDVTGELAELVLAYARKRAAEALASLRSYVSA